MSLRPWCGLLCALVLACGGGDTFDVTAIPPQQTYVGEFLSVPIQVRHAAGEAVELSFSGPDLPFLDRWAFVIGRGAGGTFQWTPTEDHVGRHTIVINARAGAQRASRAFTVEVLVAREAAPVFSSPEAGAAVDVSATPCLTVPVRASDRDTARLTLRVAFGMPAGATFTPAEPGAGLFTWCPRADQVAAAAQWVVTFGASDGAHAEVLHDFRVLLLSPTKSACGGEPPEIAWVAPEDGSAVVSKVGYEVVMRVADENPLRDRPILFYTDGRIEQRDQIELERFSVAGFAPGPDGTWVARVPTFRLAEDEAKNVSLVAFATDDDDPAGTRCDNPAVLRLRRFTAIGAIEAGVLEDCDVCQVSGDCVSGVCARTALGGRCIPACALGDVCAQGAACALWNAMEGVVRSGCGPAESVCLGESSCSADIDEPNDTPSEAAALPLQQEEERSACGRDDDWFEISVPDEGILSVDVTEGVEVQITGDGGAILAVSAGAEGGATASTCVAAASSVRARVFSPALEHTRYSVRARHQPGACLCADDAAEGHEPTALRVSVPREGRLCGVNEDTFSIGGAAGVRWTVDVAFDESTLDVDVDVVDSQGVLVRASRGVRAPETIAFDPDPSRAPYQLRVFSYDGRSGPYTVTVAERPLAGCTASSACAEREVCLSGMCRLVPCVRNADCPTGLICPLSDTANPQRTCVETCADGAECAPGRLCKEFFEGAACFAGGAGETASSCVATGDCAGARVCVDWPGGHCAIAGCDRGVPCGAGAACAMVDGRASCVQTCWVRDDACDRTDGYVCRELFEPDSEILYGCVPEGR